MPSWARDLDHLNGLDEAALATDLDGQIVFANTMARRLHRFLGEDLTRVTLSSGLLPEGDAELFDEIAGQALSGIHWAGRLDVRRVDGSVRAADVSVSPLRQGGDVVGLVCVVDDSVSLRGRGREARRLEDRLTRLARVAAELGTADDVETVTKIVVSQAADAVGATVASLSLVVSDDTLALVGLRGGVSGADRHWAHYPIDDSTPAGSVILTGKLLVLTGAREIRRRYPDLPLVSSGPRSMVGLPLTLLGRTIGVITLTFPGRRRLDAAELEFFGILADSCAQALERVRAREQAAEQTARLQFLAEAATELSTSLDYEHTLARVALLAVPTFADWCAIDLLEDDRLHRVAVEHVDPAKVQLAIELERRYPADRQAPGGAWEVIRTGRSALVPDITDEMLVASARDEDHLRLTRELDLRSALQVPLLTRGRVLGVITWVASESGRRYSQADLLFAEDFGQRCAIAIDNAQLYSQNMQVAVQLQDAVLPDLSDGVAGWEIASHYSPSGRTEVGGDFFDVHALPDGRLALFVGDVMGRGVSAAAAMGQMRASILAFLAVDPTPEVVLRKLDLLFETYAMTQLVTLVYAVADPARDELLVANAGHPPPIVLRADGRCEELPMAEGAPLGVEHERTTISRVAFGPGDTLLAFSDGLIERRDEDIDIGQRRLLDHVGSLAQHPFGNSLDRLVETVRDHTREDDVAALAVRRASAAEPTG